MLWSARPSNRTVTSLDMPCFTRFNRSCSYTNTNTDALSLTSTKHESCSSPLAPSRGHRDRPALSGTGLGSNADMSAVGYRRHTSAHVSPVQ